MAGEQTLAQRIRAKHPGAYDDLSDEQLESAVTAKFPGIYDDLPRTPTAAPIPAPQPMSFLQRLGEGAMHESAGLAAVPAVSGELAGGARAGAASTAFHGGDLIRRLFGMERVIDTPEAQAAMTPPQTAPGRLGFLGEQAAEMAVPVTKVASATRAWPMFSRVMAEAGTGGGVAAMQSGGDPETVLTTTGLGAAFPLAQAGVSAGARTVRDAAAGAREGGLGGALAGAVRTAAPGEPRAMLVQALKPRSTNVGFESRLDLAMPEIKATGRPINGVDDLLEATKAAKKRVRQQYDSMAGPARAIGSEVDLSPVAEAMERSIPKKLQLENPDAAIRLQSAAQVYRQRFSLEDAEQLLKETNAELESFYNKYPPSQRRALASDPEAARLVAQATELRKAIYSTLDAEGQGTAAREIQRRYGALLDVEMEAYRRANVAKRQQPESLSEQLSQARAAGDIAKGVWRLMRGDLTGAADLASGVAMRDTAKFLKEQQTTDALIRRAFQSYSGMPVPVPMPSHRPPRALLGPGPVVTPPPKDPSFVRGVRAQPAQSERLALPPGRPPIEVPPAPDPSFVRGVRGEYARRE